MQQLSSSTEPARAARSVFSHMCCTLVRKGQTLTKNYVSAAVSFSHMKCPLCGNAEAGELQYAENYTFAISIITGCHLSAQRSH